LRSSEEKYSSSRSNEEKKRTELSNKVGLEEDGKGLSDKVPAVTVRRCGLVGQAGKMVGTAYVMSAFRRDRHCMTLSKAYIARTPRCKVHLSTWRTSSHFGE